MSNVEFDENNRMPARPSQYLSGSDKDGLTNFFISTGMAKSKAGANIIMLVLIILCLATMGYLLIHFFGSSAGSHQRTMLPLAISNVTKIL